MDFSIASILMLDGVTNGAIYALLALAIVLVFAVTRVIFIPQGEFVAYGALTLALLQLGQVPGTVWLLLAAGAAGGAARRRVPRCAAAQPAAVVAARRRQGPRCSRRVVVGLARVGRAAPAAAAAAEPADAGDRHAARAAGLPARLREARRRDGAGAADRLGRRALRADRPRPGVLRRRGLPQPELLGRALQRRRAHADRARRSSSSWSRSR